MRRLFVFINSSLDGRVSLPNGDLSWAANDFEPFSDGDSSQVGTLLLGHRTYAMMESFWPTPQAAEMAPEVARFMNAVPKAVASRTPFQPGWENVTVLSGDAVDEVRRLKQAGSGDILVLGSSALCASLLPAGLIDELQVLVNPVILGQGTSLLDGLDDWARLSLRDVRSYASGAVLLVYRPFAGGESGSASA